MSAGRANWPRQVEPISVEDLGRLGIDPADQLFWDGRPVELRRRLVLTSLQRMAATVVTVFAILGGLGGFFSGLNNLALFLCARDISFLGCPVPAGALPAAPAVVPQR